GTDTAATLLVPPVLASSLNPSGRKSSLRDLREWTINLVIAAAAREHRFEAIRDRPRKSSTELFHGAVPDDWRNIAITLKTPSGSPVGVEKPAFHLKWRKFGK